MRLSRKTFYLLLAGAALYFAWQSYAFSADNSGIIHTTGTANQDRFSTVWLVQDGHFIWIRAAAKEPPWFEQVQVNPDIELRHDGYNVHYRATILDNRDARKHVAPLFRAKYGFVDRVREILVGRDSIPIRLEEQPG